MSTFNPTDEQLAIIDFVENREENLCVQAYAGAAKTSTLTLAARKVRGGALALAFNKAIQEELQQRLPANFTVLTMNGLGHRAWMGMMSGRKVKLLSYKTSAAIKRLGIGDKDHKLKDAVRDAVTAAKTHGLLPANHGCPLAGKTFIPDTEEGWFALADLTDFDPTEDVIHFARQVLIDSIKEAIHGTIDFSDQIYLPCVFNASFPSFKTVFVDEAQDLSPLNHYMVQKLGKSARIVAVGDELQSIYAFRGADAESMPKLRSMFKMQSLQLTTTFRCAKSIVKNVQWRAPGMQAAANAPEGVVKTLDAWGLQDIKADSAVICRNNAPLFAVGFALLAAGVPIKFLGKGLEQGLATIVTQAAGGNALASAADVAAGIQRWCDTERQRALAVGNDTRASNIQDKADALLAIPGANLQEILANLQALLNADHGSITLCTGHKAKGLEFSVVYHFNPDLPRNFAKRATTEAGKAQEKNLSYVIDTRAKSELYYISTGDWKK